MFVYMQHTWQAMPFPHVTPQVCTQQASVTLYGKIETDQLQFEYRPCQILLWPVRYSILSTRNYLQQSITEDSLQ